MLNCNTQSQATRYQNANEKSAQSYAYQQNQSASWWSESLVNHQSDLVVIDQVKNCFSFGFFDFFVLFLRSFLFFVFDFGFHLFLYFLKSVFSCLLVCCLSAFSVCISLCVCAVHICCSYKHTILLVNLCELKISN